MGSDLGALADRRRHPRVLAWEHGLPPVRVRPGHVVSVRDLSSGGLAFDCIHRVLPGQLLVLQFPGAWSDRTLRGRVVRSSVHTLSAATITYLAAVMFEQPQHWIDKLCRARLDPGAEVSSPARDGSVLCRTGA